MIDPILNPVAPTLPGLSLATLRVRPDWRTALVSVLLLAGLLALPALALIVLVDASPLAASPYRAPATALVVMLLTVALYPLLHPRVRDLTDRLAFRRRYEARQTLRRFSQEASAILDLDELARLTVNAGFEIASASHVALLSPDEPAGYYRVVAWRSAPPLPAEGTPSFATVQLDPAHPVINYLSGTGRLLTAAEFEGLPLFQHLWPQERRAWEQLAAQVLIPLCSHDHLIGLLVVGAAIPSPAIPLVGRVLKKYPHSPQSTQTLRKPGGLSGLYGASRDLFSRLVGRGKGGDHPPETLAALEQLALQAAEALERAQLRAQAHRLQTTLGVLYESGQELAASQEQERLLQATLSGALHLTDADLAWIVLLDQANGQPAWHATLTRAGAYQAGTPTGPDAALLELVFQQPPLVVDDLTADPRTPALVVADARSLLAVPLVAGPERLGILAVADARPQRYNEHQRRLLETHAGRAALALHHSRLAALQHRFEQELESRVALRTQDLVQANLSLHREKDRLGVLYEIAQDLSAGLALDDLLGKALRLAATAVAAERGSVMVLNTRTGQLIYKAVLEADRQVTISNQPTQFQPGVGLAGWVAKHRQAALVPDVTQDPRWLAMTETPANIRAAIVLPLHIGPETLGVLFLAHSQPGYFGDEHLRLLSPVANAMAVLIHNAELYQYIGEQAEELARRLREQESTTAQAQAILNNIADGVIVNDMEGRILLVNPAAEKLVGLYARTLEGQSWQNIGKTLTAAGYAELAARLAEATARVRRGRYRPLQHTFEMDDQKIQAHLVPVITRTGEPLGLVTVLHNITPDRELDRLKAEFASHITHELRTPLTAIKGYLDLVLDGDAGEISPQAQDFLQVVRSNSNRLAYLVDNLLDIA